MKLFVADTHKAMSQQALQDLLKLTQDYTHPLVCTASGDTPAALYKALTDFIVHTNTDISAWHFVSLDEWVGMNGSDEGSCRYYLDQQLFQPLSVPQENLCFFDGRAANPALECEKVEQFIQQHEHISVAIVGLGMNGHVGMNEPGISPTLRSHVADIHPVTKEVGQKYFKKEQDLSKGLTLGLATLMEADYIFLLVNGGHKAGIVQQVMEGEITNELPASLLRNHDGLRVYLDEAAAAQLHLR